MRRCYAPGIFNAVKRQLDQEKLERINHFFITAKLRGSTEHFRDVSRPKLRVNFQLMHAYVEMNTANESLLRIFWVDDYGCQLLLRKIVQFAFISSILRRSGKELLFP